MGLYSRIVSYINNKHPGLLKLAEKELENNPVVLFNTEIRSLNIEKACILVCNDGVFRLFLSSGFSQDKLSDSISTSDFWDGTLPHQDWVHYSHDEATPFLQLFSKDDVSDIAKLHIKRFSVADIQYIFISAETDTNTEVSVDSLDHLISSFSQLILKNA
ncbi:MAG: hypothetical protein KBT02_07615 [Treponema sp.]|nr:hypothetical protein [Candidatus Treponema caballi]